MTLFKIVKKAISKIKNNDLRYSLTKRKYLKMRKKRCFSKKYKFVNRQKGTKKLILVLAGFQPYYWEMMASNIKNSNYDNSDVCICIPQGNTECEVLSKLYYIAEKYDWSVCYIKQDKLSLVQNIAIKLHPNAKIIYKFDEDIMVPIYFFERMDRAREKIIEEKNYDAGIIVPVINVNLATMSEFLRVIDENSVFNREYDIKEMGLRGIHQSKGAGLKLTELVGDSINKCADRIYDKNLGKYYALPIRFSIGAISFTRDFWEEIGYFVVEDFGTMGAEEEQVCAYCVNESKPCVCALDCFAVHLGYYMQKEICKEYFLKYDSYFDNSKEYER